jgi:predicted RNA-binding protein YlqC (UPF0109 family)
LSKQAAVPNPAELIESIVRAFVDNPERVSVEEVSNELRSTLYLRVDAADKHKVIGSHGGMESALEEILRAESVKLKHLYTLEITDDSDVDLQPAV